MGCMSEIQNTNSSRQAGGVENQFRAGKRTQFKPEFFFQSIALKRLQNKY